MIDISSTHESFSIMDLSIYEEEQAHNTKRTLHEGQCDVFFAPGVICDTQDFQVDSA